MAVNVEIHLNCAHGDWSCQLVCPCYYSEPLNGYPHSLLESLIHLLQEGHEQPIQSEGVAGIRLLVKIPKCFDSHVLLAFPLTENPDGSRVQRIYGIQLDANQYLQKDEIALKIACTFGMQEIKHLIPYKVTKPNPAECLQPHTSFADLDAHNQNRKFGCGTLFLAQLDDNSNSCSTPASPSSPFSQHLSPNLDPTIDQYANVFSEPHSNQESHNVHPTTNAEVMIATPHAVPKQVEVGPSKSLRDGPVLTQVMSEIPTHLRMWEKSAGDTGLLKRYQADPPSTSQYQPSYNRRGDTPTVAEIDLSHTPMQFGEEESVSESSDGSLHDNHLPQPSKQQQILGTFLGLPSDMVAAVVPGKLQQDRHSEPPSEASTAVERVHNLLARRLSDPTPSASVRHTTPLAHVTPVQRQTSTEGEAVIAPAVNALSKQLNLRLSLQGLQQEASTCSLESSNVPEEEMQNVYALEHVCNGVCMLGSACMKKCNNPQHVKEMKESVQRIQDGEPASEDMKRYIRRHCEYCRSRECRVPHAAAGCLSPALLPSSSCTPSLGSCTGIDDVSFDLQANCSNTESYTASNASMVTTCIDSSKLGPPCKPHQDTNLDSPDLPYGQIRMTPASNIPLHRPLARHTFIASPDIVQTQTIDQHREKHFNLENAPMVCSRQARCGVAYPAVGTENAGRRTYSYLEPNAEANALLRQQVHVPQVNHQVADVWKNGFPGGSTYVPCQPGTIIYSSDEMQHMVPGYTIPIPNIDGVANADILGIGGNGKTFKYHFNKKEFAVKWTYYRPIELNLWYKFKHPNVIPLHAVVWASNNRCFQFMPRMTTNLSRVLRDVGNLITIYEDVTEDMWRHSVMTNVRYILRAILQGIEYLHSHDVQHCDIKASNVLILKKCSCANVFHCTCLKQYKYSVQIADFDSSKSISARNQSSASIPEVPCVSKTLEERGKVMGTPGYRAPEAWMLYFERHRKEFSRNEPQAEGAHALIKLINLLSCEHRQMQLAGQFAKSCLEIDYHERLSAKHLLSHQFFQE